MITIPIEIGDWIRVGKFKNKRIQVKEIGTDEMGLPTCNGRGIMKIRVEKLMPPKEIKEETMDIKESPAMNNPKVQRIVDEINKLIASAVDSDGDPIGVVDRSSSWQEPYVYSPIEYKNGQLKITSKSQYKNKPEVDVISKKNMELDGIPTLRNIATMYKKAIKQDAKPKPVEEQITTKQSKLNRLKRLVEERGLKVKIKNEDGKFWIYLQTEKGEHCLTNVGFETKELAQHSALTKGFEVVGNEEPYDFPETVEVPKPTKAEPVKFEKPKEEDLGKEKTTKLESLLRRIIKEEIKKKVSINELEVTDPDIAKKIEEMARISDEMDRLKNELAKLKKLFDPLDEEITKLMDEADANGHAALETKDVLVTIKKKGYEAKSPKYKESFLQLYERVNAAMKAKADALLESNTEMKKYATTLAVQYKKNESVLKEENLVSRLFNKVKNYFSNIFNKIMKFNKEIETGVDKLKQFANI